MPTYDTPAVLRAADALDDPETVTGNLARVAWKTLNAGLSLDEMARTAQQHAHCTVVMFDEGAAMSCEMPIPPAPDGATFRTTHMMDAVRAATLGSDQ